MCKTYHSQLFFLIVLLSIFFVACGNNLEEKLMLIEQRVLDEARFGRQISDYMKSKNTRYILEPTLPYQARYSVADDSIHYNPKFNAPPGQWKKELLQGRPIGTILKFHEELHRRQVSISERGRFFQFFRENGHIDEQIIHGKAIYEFTLNVDYGDEGKLLNFAGSLVGYPILDLKTAAEIVRQKMDGMNAPYYREKLLLDEIQAYIGSDIVTAKGVYAQLYEDKKKGYENFPKISFSEFSQLCDFVVQLYGFYDGNHDEVCKVLGKSKSIKDFQSKVKSIFWGSSKGDINQKADGWMEMKKDWARETIRIAREVLKEQHDR